MSEQDKVRALSKPRALPAGTQQDLGRFDQLTTKINRELDTILSEATSLKSQLNAVKNDSPDWQDLMDYVDGVIGALEPILNGSAFHG